MKTFKNICAQGDIMIMRTDMNIPEGATRVPLEDGKLIVTHSETGHHHAFLNVMEKPDGKAPVEMYQLPDDIMKCLLVVNEPSTLEHLRSFDTHESIAFDQGTYIVKRQREYTPEGWRRVED